MTRLSELLDEEMAHELRALTDAGAFPGLPFTTAMEFLLSDGIMPESGLPVLSFLKLEDWARARGTARRVH